MPTARELATGPGERQLIETMEAPFALTRPYAGPAGISPARTKALQAAFMAVQSDEAYLGEARRLKLDVSPIGPAEVDALLGRIAAVPEALKNDVRKLVGGSKAK